MSVGRIVRRRHEETPSRRQERQDRSARNALQRRLRRDADGSSAIIANRRRSGQRNVRRRFGCAAHIGRRDRNRLRTHIATIA
jgi:hypothetical protein